MITANIDGVQYQWENHAELTGWFKPEELNGESPLPSQGDLYVREWRLETINAELNGKE